MAWNHCTRSSSIGAAADTKIRPRSRPSCERIGRPACGRAQGVDQAGLPGRRVPQTLAGVDDRRPGRRDGRPGPARHEGVRRPPRPRTGTSPRPAAPRRRSWAGRRAVLGHRGEAAGEPGLAARDDLADVADAALGDVRQGQERQETVARPHADHPHDGADGLGHVLVRDHRPLGGAGGPARVDQRRDRIRAHPGPARRPSPGPARAAGARATAGRRT